MKIKTQVGIIHLHKTYAREGSYEIWQVCDSDDEFIANLYGQSSLKHFLTHITAIKHISDLCDFGGLVDNMTFGETPREACIEVLDYVQEEKFNWGGEEWDYTEEDIEALKDYVNRVGDNYFIVDFTDI